MDINISANTLFHFTTGKKVLLNILEHGIYVRYSLENYENLIADGAEMAIPMACFCDIPLSQVKRHKDTYGSYAIGLSKEWGMRNKINPVIYTYPGSSTTEILNDLYGNITDFYNIDTDEIPKKKPSISAAQRKKIKDEYKIDLLGKSLSLQSKLGHFLRFIKPYEGKFYRENKYLDNTVKFYDEREWRFTPPINFFDNFGKAPKDSYKPEYYKDPRKRRAINIKLAPHIKLTFNPLDIRFIIVKTEKEIPEMLRHLDAIFGDTVPLNSLKLLGTRLISFEQIIQDL